MIKTLPYVAESVIARLRLGELPSNAEAEQLNRQPLIDDLRAVVLESDVAWLLEVMERETSEVAAFYSSLLRRFADRAEVQTRLQARWRTADSLLRVHLLWRILDDPQLATEWHERLFDFVLEEWQLFGRICITFMGPNDGIRQILHRLGDPSFPDAKKWAYLCRLPHLADDQQAAKAILILGRSLPDVFTRRVAEILLKRLDGV